MNTQNKGFFIGLIISCVSLNLYAVVYKHDDVLVELSDSSRPLSVFNVSSYNGLKEAEEANQVLLERSNFETLLKEAGPWICKHEMQDYIGLRLLHKHNDLSAGDRMVEYFSDEYDDGALVTGKFLPVDESSGEPLKAVPSIWAAASVENEEPFFALEYTTDEGGRAAYAKISTQQEFLVGLRSILAGHNLEDLIGISSITRLSLKAKADQVFMELIDLDLVENVLLLTDVKDPLMSSSIQTSWRFEALNPQEGIITHGCKTVTVCIHTPIASFKKTVHKKTKSK